LPPALSAELPAGMAMSPVYHGEPDTVTAAVLAGPGLSAVDELVLFLPPVFGLAENVRLLTDLARTVAPALGWSPSPGAVAAAREALRDARAAVASARCTAGEAACPSASHSP
jgi:hypothetical protein